MRFENQNRYKQYIPQESTRPFLPVLMVKTDYSQENGQIENCWRFSLSRDKFTGMWIIEGL
jgi:hypothetical protein